MREQLVSTLSVSSQSGITPAHAGTTEAAALAELEGKDHPRSCGNNQGEHRWS